jgi:hypothetical protein
MGVSKNEEWRSDVEKTACSGRESDKANGPEFKLLLEAIQEVAEELRRHKKAVQIREQPENVEMSVVGSKGLEMELALSVDGVPGLWLFSKRVVISNFPVSALAIKSKEEALKGLAVLYRAAKSWGPRI